MDREALVKSKAITSESENVVKGVDDGIEVEGDGHVLGRDNYTLILQEVWFAAMISSLIILLVIIFGAVICIKRRKSILKNSLGNYNGE